jgi:isopenicillin-N N-acyltransferase-like protein
MVILLIPLVISICAATAHGAYCNGSPAEGERTNAFPIFDETDMV